MGDSLSQVGEDLLLSINRSQVRKQLQDRPIFIDDHRRAPPIGRVGQVPFIPGFRHPIGYGDGPIFVENNREGEIFPLYPSPSRFLVPVVDPKDQDVFFHEVGIIVTVPVTVASSITAPRR